MGWANCGEDSKGRPIGYAWPGGYQLAGPGGRQLQEVMKTARRVIATFADDGGGRDDLLES